MHSASADIGVAIASRVGIAGVVTNFGAPLRPATSDDTGDDEPLAEARMIAATGGGVRGVSVYVPNGRSVGSIFHQAKLVWLERLRVWLTEQASATEPLVVGGDFNIAPADADVWDPKALIGMTHVSTKERAAPARSNTPVTRSTRTSSSGTRSAPGVLGGGSTNRPIDGPSSGTVQRESVSGVIAFT